jgi:hypothetical protein
MNVSPAVLAKQQLLESTINLLLTTYVYLSRCRPSMIPGREKESLLIYAEGDNLDA